MLASTDLTASSPPCWSLARSKRCQSATVSLPAASTSESPSKTCPFQSRTSVAPGLELTTGCATVVGPRRWRTAPKKRRTWPERVVCRCKTCESGPVERRAMHKSTEAVCQSGSEDRVVRGVWGIERRQREKPTSRLVALNEAFKECWIERRARRREGKDDAAHPRSDSCWSRSRCGAALSSLSRSGRLTTRTTSRRSPCHPPLLSASIRPEP
jgi:hypothetical protein